MSSRPTSIEEWLAACPDPIPLRATEASALGRSLRELMEQSPKIRGSKIEAMLWLRIGVIDPAHAIVQDGRDDVEKYLHGIVHRLEGDFWNSNYWFRQVRDRVFLGTVGRNIAASLRTAGLYEWATQFQFVDGESFVPQRFVEACEKFFSVRKVHAANEDDKLLLNVGQYEWRSVWDVVVDCERVEQ